MKLRVLQHVPFEGPAFIAEWAAANGHALVPTRLHAGDALPAAGDFDRLVVLGGPMNIYEEDHYPWLAGEKALIRDAIDAGRSVVGICLGAQLVADALGCEVYPVGQKEIGWYPLELTDAARAHPLTRGLPAVLPVFHWHGETFDLPDGAVHLARTAACEHQAFVWDDRVLALQCHLEMTPSSVDAILAGCEDELARAQGGAYVQPPERLRAAGTSDYASGHQALATLLDRLPV